MRNYNAFGKTVWAVTLLLIVLSPGWGAGHKPGAAPKGAGVVVCEPVTADPALADFGAGGAGWLQLALGGQPALGQTPPWAARQRAARELGRADLQLTPAQAASLATITGATHAVTGTLSGTPDAATLRLQVWRVPARAPVGAALVASGSEDRIVAHLPEMARILALRLGVARPLAAPAAPGTPKETGFLGRMIHTQRPDMTDAQTQQLEALTAHSPLAGLLSLNRGAERNESRRQALARTLSDEAPGNAFVWAQVGDLDPAGLPARSAALAALAQTFPNTLGFRLAQVVLAVERHDGPGGVAAARQAVRCAPRSPDAWATLSVALGDAADAIRHARGFSQMSAKEAVRLAPMYPEAVQASRRATELDPRHAGAWRSLAVSAAFAGDGALAVKAYDRAQALLTAQGEQAQDTEQAALLAWGLQMFQPKWYDDPARLKAVAERAAAYPWRDDASAVHMASELRAAGFDAQGADTGLKFIFRVVDEIKQRPDDAGLLVRVAAGQAAVRDFDRAVGSLRDAAKKRPDDADVRARLAQALWDQGSHDDAVTQWRECLRLDPFHPGASLRLGEALLDKGDAAGAIPSLQDAREEPSSTDRDRAKIDFDLGAANTDLHKPAAAIASYRQAVREWPWYPEARRRLADLLRDAGRWQDLRDAAQGMLALSPSDTGARRDTALAALKLGRAAESAALCRAALEDAPDDAGLHLVLGDALLALGRKSEARAEWTQAVTLDPNEPAGVAAKRELDANP